MHIELNSMADRLIFYAAHPKRKLLSRKPKCTFLYLYHPHIPDNEESWQFFLDNERICALLNNEPLNKNEIISLDDNKFPKGLTPLEGSLSSSDVNNYNKIEPEDLIRKIEYTIPMNIGMEEDPEILKIGGQFSEEERKKFIDLFCEFRDVFS